MNDLNLQMTIDKNNHQYPCYSREILQEIRIPMIVLTTLFPQIFWQIRHIELLHLRVSVCWFLLLMLHCQNKKFMSKLNHFVLEDFDQYISFLPGIIRVYK